jgi:transposase InsO family protein
MPWKESTVMKERVSFIVESQMADINFSALCRQHGISRRTGYRWQTRYRQAGSLAEVKELSRRPHRVANKIAPDIEERVVGLREFYGWCADSLDVLLRQEGICLSVSTINRIIKRHDLINPEDSHKKATKRFERAAANELWQMDFKGHYYMPGKLFCYPLSILDDHSRYLVGLFALGDKLGKSVDVCLIRVFERFGVPEAMLMDHGTPWWSVHNGYGLTSLSVSLLKQGIRLCLSGIGHPQTQGKVERFHRTLKRAMRRKGKPVNLASWQEAFEEFRQEYNEVRPHHALNLKVPASRYSPSLKLYNAKPREWEYPSGAIVKRLNNQGMVEYRSRRYFVCEALRGERVQLIEFQDSLLVKYRHMYIREINLSTGRTNAILAAEYKNKL